MWDEQAEVRTEDWRETEKTEIECEFPKRIYKTARQQYCWEGGVGRGCGRNHLGMQGLESTATITTVCRM